MRDESGADITRLLREAAEGDRDSLDHLVPLLYEHLRRLAHHRLHAERSGHTLNTTALVHEAYLELVDVDHARWRDRAHFLAAASRVMRHLLVDYARARNAKKRGGGWVQAALEPDELLLSEEHAEVVEELDGALERLAELSPRKARLLEQRYFGGLKLEECAEALGVSLATVKNDLKLGRAWLARELKPQIAGRMAS
ncbi:MAG: sigma-70 family RNA polymerase sigma factor [Gemmatimonadales bacterium]|jgi:RNA polymerase sigma factor (TIGR02999 family)